MITKRLILNGDRRCKDLIPHAFAVRRVRLMLQVILGCYSEVEDLLASPEVCSETAPLLCVGMLMIVWIPTLLGWCRFVLALLSLATSLLPLLLHENWGSHGHVG